MKFERSLLQKLSFREADIQTEYWKTKSYTERLEAATVMIKLSYGIVDQEFPEMEKNLFSMHSHYGKNL